MDLLNMLVQIWNNINHGRRFGAHSTSAFTANTYGRRPTPTPVEFGDPHGKIVIRVKCAQGPSDTATHSFR